MYTKDKQRRSNIAIYFVDQDEEKKFRHFWGLAKAKAFERRQNNVEMLLEALKLYIEKSADKANDY